MPPKNDEPDLEGGSADLFDRERIRDYLVFLRGAVRRRRRLGGAVLLGIMALTGLVLASMPSTYHVEAKLLTQRIAVLPVRGEGPDTAAPTRGAAETIRRRDNLVALIEATDLLNHWDAHRAPSQRAIDGLRGLFHTDSEEDRRDAMVERLEKRLVTWTNEGTVTIAVDWPDAAMACRLVDIVQQDFLEERYTQEVTALSESISILRSHAESLRTEVDGAVTAVLDLRARRQDPGAASAPAAAPAAPVVEAPRPAARRPTEANPEAEQVRSQLVAKQRALDDLEGFRRNRLSEAQARLAEQRGTYTDEHPVIIELQRTVAALSAPSPQVKALRDDAAALRAEVERMGAAAGGPAAAGSLARGASGAATPARLPGEILRLDQELQEDRDPSTVYARGQLRDAMDKYSALRDKVEAAQIDLETAQAAFKYRYSVLAPARLPKRPASPNAPLVLIVAFFAALLGAVLVAIVADVRGGKIVERWQIERLLDRPILGEIDLPRLPKHGSP